MLIFELGLFVMTEYDVDIMTSPPCVIDLLQRSTQVKTVYTVL